MNVDFDKLMINGYSDQLVPNQFLRQRDETSTLAVLLPGQGYTADMPLFYYSEWIALERGWDVLRVDYDYRSLEYDEDLDIRRKRLEERMQQLHSDVGAAFIGGLQQRDYEIVVLVGKSLGTRAMTYLLSQGISQNLWNVWLTPLINGQDVRECIEQHPGQTFVAIGTEDFAYDQEYLERLEASGEVEIVGVEGADHSMDISGDIARSIHAMGQLMSRLDAFLPEQKQSTPKSSF